MARAPQHRFQVLTKRAQRMRDYLSRFHPADDPRGPGASGFITRDGLPVAEREGALFRADRWPLPNVWLGVSVEDQTRAQERVPPLLQSPAAVRWISAEPLLGPLDLTRVEVRLGERSREQIDSLRARSGLDFAGTERPALDWIIAGGESGPNARPSHPDWFRSLRDQCVAAEVPFLFKQHGDWIGFIEAQQEPYWQRADGELVDGHALNIDDDDPRWSVLGGLDSRPLCVAQLVGKKRAGRVLDSRTWDQFPEARS